MSKRLRKISKLNLAPVIITDENDIAALQQLAKECLDYFLINDETDVDDLNSLLIEENFDPIILEDTDSLEVNREYYQKPKSRPLPTNKNWYI